MTPKSNHRPWLLLLALSCLTGWSAETTPVITRGPYLQFATPQSMTIIWRSDLVRLTPVVKIGRTLQQLDREISGKAVLTRAALGTTNCPWLPELQPLRSAANRRLPALHSAPLGTFQYEARITNLTPDTEYFYAVYDGNTRLTPSDPSYRFRTYPAPGQARPTVWWVVGDGGTARKQQELVYRSALQVAEREGKSFDLALYVGDMAYMSGKDVEFQTRYFNMYGETLRHLVCWPTFANHEGYTSKSDRQIGPYYDAYALPTKGEAGGHPSGTEAWYSFDYGRIHVVSLNSYDVSRATNGPMAKWLRQDLEQARRQGNSDWLVAFCHHAPFTKGSHDGDKERELVEMRKNILPILERGGVDAIFTGHSHSYERTMLIDGAYGTNIVADKFVLDDGDGNPYGDGPYFKSAGLKPNEGQVHAVVGHGGTTLGRKGSLLVGHNMYIGHGSLILEIKGDTLTATALTAFGDKMDCFQIVKRGQVTPVRHALPWQPEEWKKPDNYTQEGFPAQIPLTHSVIIPAGAEWQYLAGKHPQGYAWMFDQFNASGWKTGLSPFGYKYPEVATSVERMKGQSSVLYLRKEFDIARPDRLADLGLMIKYDDGIIVWLNGKEVGRRNVERGSGTRAQKIKSHPADDYQYVALQDFHRHLKPGRNVLAIQGHNSTKDSSDLLVDAYLVAED
jgi:hypothetical protein